MSTPAPFSRSEFPMLEDGASTPLLYFDSAATTLKPQVVIEALMRYYTQESATVHRGVYHLAQKATQQQHLTRTKVKSFIHAKSEREIVFTSGTTAALNLLSYSLGETVIRAGDEILIPEIEHHSNIVPWQILAQRKGALLKTIPVLDSSDLDLNALKELLTPKTKIVSFAHISNVFGTIHPVKEIVSIIRKQSKAQIILDAAQSIAHYPIDVQDLDVDYLVFSAHKLYGPTGIGVLYGKEKLLDSLSPYQAGGDMISNVSWNETTYNELPFKFEAGTPHIAGLYGLGAAIDYLQEKGIDRVHAYEQFLTHYAQSKLEEIPEINIIGRSKKRSSILSFTVQGVHPLDLMTLLNFKNIAMRSGHLCAQPALSRFNLSSLLRLSFAPYNTTDEIDLFRVYLKEALKKLF